MGDFYISLIVFQGRVRGAGFLIHDDVLMIDQHYGQVKTMQATGMLTRLARNA